MSGGFAMKKTLFLILAFCMLAGMSAFAETQQPKVGLVISTLNNPFFVTLRDGAVAQAKISGINLIILDSQNDSAKELANVEDLVGQKVAAILINPTDSDAVGSAIKLANRSKIPVVTLDRGANSGVVVSHIASDNVAGGVMAGEFIIKMLGSKGNVVELEGLAGTSAARDRGRGFNSAISKTNIKVVSRQTADFDRTKGLSVMENILQAQSAIDAVFAHNDEMALGALKAIQGTKRRILVVGFDATDDALAAVKAGTMAATVAQQPALIGSTGVITIKAILDKKQVEPFIPVALKLVTK
jgi:ribose transport system substrate-binding protein